ncbi:hypothetical protein BU23DRAFT_125274 [Bimuria novae-zelandiae CBS 107.79]|uniref:Uncharacterized protein n=1 Tax=Bimuria novae-zelandiae CBS 107.79 TaxID=1447943 RepID=A0A6A5V9N7_9PLEO|nr:hypothetical protein BU23DRAFT_125274 [Bimuria novae-zelandiae CBS 107.79]
MPSGYNSQQKAAISQFMNFASTDQKTAIKHLKSAGWDASAAVNSDSFAATRRRNWYQTALSRDQKTAFRLIIGRRRSEIENSAPLRIDTQVARMEGPAMMLHEALEAVETRYDAHIPPVSANPPPVYANPPPVYGYPPQATTNTTSYNQLGNPVAPPYTAYQSLYGSFSGQCALPTSHSAPHLGYRPPQPGYQPPQPGYQPPQPGYQLKPGGYWSQPGYQPRTAHRNATGDSTFDMGDLPTY